MFFNTKLYIESKYSIFSQKFQWVTFEISIHCTFIKTFHNFYEKTFHSVGIAKVFLSSCGKLDLRAENNSH